MSGCSVPTSPSPAGCTTRCLPRERYGFDTVQVFTKNQQQWACPPLGRVAIERVVHAPEAAEVQAHGQPRQLPDQPRVAGRGVRGKSIKLFIEEVSRCRSAGDPVPRHPPRGAHGRRGGGGADARRRGAGRGPRGGAEGGGDHLPGDHGRAGDVPGPPAGAPRGDHRAGEVAGAARRSASTRPTCSPRATTSAAASTPGSCTRWKDGRASKRVKVLHLNDSKKDLGSRVDRHDHIGRGQDRPGRVPAVRAG